MSYTTADLLRAIERRSFAPSNQLTYQPAEILSIADEEMETTILPSILAVREEFFVHHKDYSITAGRSGYDIPARSAGMIVREVQIIGENGNVIDLTRKEPEDLTSTATGNPHAFYLRNNQVHLYPTPNATQSTLRIQYFLEPGYLVETASAAVISAIDTDLNTVTVTSIPNAWVTGDTFDFVKKDGGQEYVEVDQISTDITGPVITFSSLPSTLKVGDYVTPQETSPLVQLPRNYRTVLAQCVAATLLESMNQTGASDARKRAEMLLEAAQKLITPRVQGEQRTVIPSNWF